MKILERSVWGIVFFLFLTGSLAEAETKSYDVVVIGGGGGGLSAGAYLAKAGKKVLLIEQHSKVGGYMTNFQRGAYTFEVSLHAMDGLDDVPNGNRALFKELGIWDKIKPVRLDPVYRVVYPGLSLNIPADPEAYKKLLQTQFPAEAQGITRLFKAYQQIWDSLGALMLLQAGEYSQALKTAFQNPTAFFVLFKYWNKTVAEMLSDYIQDPKLVAIFTELTGFLGDSPANIPAVLFSVMWGSYHFNGFYNFIGGSQSVSNALAEVIMENGGEIKLNTLVTKIIVEEGRAVGVRTNDGSEYRAKYVVSNANALDTFFKLVGEEHLPKDYLERLKKMEISCSAFQVYLGVNYDYRELFQGTHDIMVAYSWEVEKNYQYALQGDLEKISYAMLNYSVFDPTAAPPGKNVIVITALLPYDWKNGWYEKEDYNKYRALKEEVAKALVKKAEEILPNLSKHIEVMEVGSPRTMEHFTLNPKGAILGWANTPEQSLMKRLPQETPIKNLYLAGAWTFPAGGQSAVIGSGVMAGQKILAQEKKRQ